MKPQRMQGVDGAVTEADIHRHWRALADQFGYANYSSTAVIDGADGRPRFWTTYNLVSGYQELMEDVARGRRDPTAQHCKHRSTPIVYTQATYAEAGAGDLWEEQAPFGYSNGILLAVHLPGGRHYMGGIDRGGRPPTDRRELQRAVEAVQQFLFAACEAFFEVQTGIAHATGEQLSQTELDALQLVYAGYDPNAIADRLTIGDSELSERFRSATRKLRVTDVRHAANRAYRLALIS